MALPEFDRPKRPKHPFEKNRELFAKLVYSTGEFTSEEIIEKFRDQRGGDDIARIAIDGKQTIGEYLQDLVEIGVLSKEDNVFTVVCHPVDYIK